MRIKDTLAWIFGPPHSGLPGEARAYSRRSSWSSARAGSIPERKGRTLRPPGAQRRRLFSARQSFHSPLKTQRFPKLKSSPADQKSHGPATACVFCSTGTKAVVLIQPAPYVGRHAAVKRAVGTENQIDAPRSRPGCPHQCAFLHPGAKVQPSAASAMHNTPFSPTFSRAKSA